MSSATLPAGVAAAPAGNHQTAKGDGRTTRRLLRRQLDIPEHVQGAVRTLQQRGFQAFVVGGSIRDLLLGKRPKDFDVSTDARPEQVKSVFRRSARLVGRRFLIAHLRLHRHREIIEVTTFRSGGPPSAKNVQDSNGQLLSDNVYGKSVEEDARRRDFSVNALYYDPEKQQVHDFVGGLEDLEAKRLRVIGDPELRYREDPVRMLRALHFIARLGFDLDPENSAALLRLAGGITGARPARLALEMRKIFSAECCARTWELLEEYGLFAALFPGAAAMIREEPRHGRLVREVLRNTQQRIRGGGKNNLSFLYAAFLWPVLQQEMEYNAAGKPWRFEELHQTGTRILREQAQRIGLAGYMRGRIIACWEMQMHLARRQGKDGRAQQLAAQRDFRSGLALLELRCQSGEDELQERVQWWRSRERPAAARRTASASRSGGRSRSSGRRQRPR